MSAPLASSSEESRAGETAPRRLSSFTFQSADGFYKGPDEDISWNRHGPEELRFSEEQIARGDVLVFGRRTYEHMAAFWTLPLAEERMPAIAAGMNRAEKIVVSTSLREAPWGPARIVGSDALAAFRALKGEEGPDMTILGSGELVRALAAQGLIDTLQIMIYPVAIGRGATLFEGLAEPLGLTLTGHRIFASGTALLDYSPDGAERRSTIDGP
ncbi:MAG: dihydrofolate reductase family protein [Microvirga sp.]|nr:dihydrofolate reductase family protein [Microvirga sp.]